MRIIGSFYLRTKKRRLEESQVYAKVETPNEAVSRRVNIMTDFRFVTRNHVRSKVKPTGTGGAKVSVPSDWLSRGQVAVVKLILENEGQND